jgi:PTH1 family peptidyl-tRNA hydrolase
MRLVVGLGNPGKEYEATRHNAGFMVVDELARRFGVEQWRTKDQARQALVSGRRVVLVEPVSFMNASGIPVRVIASWYRVPPENVLVINDDMDLPFGKLRMRPTGGHGGHNGLRSLIATLGENFPRLRFGVGRPRTDESSQGPAPIDHVLSPFSADEARSLPQIVSAATDGVEKWLEGGLEPAMQVVNTWSL